MWYSYNVVETWMCGSRGCGIVMMWWSRGYGGVVDVMESWIWYSYDVVESWMWGSRGCGIVMMWWSRGCGGVVDVVES